MTTLKLVCAILCVQFKTAHQSRQYNRHQSPTVQRALPVMTVATVAVTGIDPATRIALDLLKVHENGQAAAIGT